MQLTESRTHYVATSFQTSNFSDDLIVVFFWAVKQIQKRKLLFGRLF